MWVLGTARVMTRRTRPMWVLGTARVMLGAAFIVLAALVMAVPATALVLVAPATAPASGTRSVDAVVGLGAVVGAAAAGAVGAVVGGA